MGFLITLKAVAFVLACGALLGCIVAGIAYLIQKADGYIGVGLAVGLGMSSLALLVIGAAWAAQNLLH